MACPVDFVAVPLLAIGGGAVGASRAVELKPGWTERPSVYAAAVGRPGSAKSPALKAVAAHVYSRQARLKAEHDAAMREYELQKAAYDAAVKRSGRSESGGRLRIRRPEDDEAPAVPPPEKPVPPVLHRTYASDTTVEALAPVLAANPRGVTVIRDELTAWVAAMNQYKAGRGADRQFYLAAWAGEPLCVDRKGQGGVPIIVPHPFLCVVGCLPPDMVGSLREKHNVSDGFLDRILFAYPDATPIAGHNDICVTDERAAAWRDTLDFLSGLNMAPNDGGGCRPYFVRLTPEGREAWKHFLDSHAAEMNGPDFPDGLLGPWSKFRGYGARLALILQLLRAAQKDGTEETVDEQSVRGAARLVDYFKGHAAKVYRELDASRLVADCRKVLRWIRRERLTTFSKRDAHNALQGTFKTVDELEPVLGLLTRHHYIRLAPQAGREGAGRKASPVYEVNPATLSTESTELTESNAREWVL
jgi:hypothetical protein